MGSNHVGNNNFTGDHSRTNRPQGFGEPVVNQQVTSFRIGQRENPNYFDDFKKLHELGKGFGNAKGRRDFGGM